MERHSLGLASITGPSALCCQNTTKERDLTMDSRNFISHLHKAESDVNIAAQRLERTFKNAGHKLSIQGAEIPDPIKLVRRLTALEIALKHLKDDCDTITESRTNLVRLVLDRQNHNLFQAEKMLEAVQHQRQSPNQDEEIDDSWNDITETWKQQYELCCIATNED